MTEKTLKQLQEKLAKKTRKLEKLQRLIEEQLAEERGLTLEAEFYDAEKIKPQRRGYVDGDDNRTGEWTYWHDNGQRHYKGSYNDGNRTGEWTYWYENGTLLKVSQLDNGTEMEAKND